MMPVFFVDAGDERLIRSSATSGADELKNFLNIFYREFINKKYFLKKF